MLSVSANKYDMYNSTNKYLSKNSAKQQEINQKREIDQRKEFFKFGGCVLTGTLGGFLGGMKLDDKIAPVEGPWNAKREFAGLAAVVGCTFAGIALGTLIYKKLFETKPCSE